MHYFIILGQILLSLYFVVGAYTDITMRQQGLQLLATKKIPLPNISYFCGVALKIIAGLALMFNIFAGIAALLLAIFTLVADIIFNNFWREEPGMKRQFTLARFLCNLAVVGGLLIVVGMRQI